MQFYHRRRATPSYAFDIRKVSLIVPKEPFWYKKAFTYIASIVLFGGLVFLHQTTEATVMSFYPTTCLGGWNASGNANSVPTLAVDAPPEQYTSDNAAIYIPGTDIYCGDFTGEIPKDATPSMFTVHLRWAIDNGSVIHGNVATPQVPLPSDESAVMENTSSDPDQSTTETLPVDTPIDPAENASLQTFLDNAFGAPRALAKEVSSNAFFEVEYTLDGTTWQTLGTVGWDNWYDASYTLPLSTWDDLSKLQIAIKALPTLDAFPQVYLDAIAVDINYKTNTTPIVADPEASDQKRYDITLSDLPASAKLSIVHQEDQGNILLITPHTHGIIHIYSESDPGFSFETVLGDTSVEIPAYQLPPGTLTAVFSADTVGCVGLSHDACVAKPLFIEEVPIVVTPTVETPLAEQPTPADVFNTLTSVSSSAEETPSSNTSLEIVPDNILKTSPADTSFVEKATQFFEQLVPSDTSPPPSVSSSE